ncbi:hypothetical protein [Rubeoparvulum massiliense]|uniref:hypothetical protein n=1 Tax=Rubeoparvulum massiliense TaxID=1631346 RepID=UPI00065E50AD|nr:hypothetical protein [Rubeoparvulum massiliense]
MKKSSPLVLSFLLVLSTSVLVQNSSDEPNVSSSTKYQITNDFGKLTISKSDANGTYTEYVQEDEDALKRIIKGGNIDVPDGYKLTKVITTVVNSR